MNKQLITIITYVILAFGGYSQNFTNLKVSYTNYSDGEKVNRYYYFKNEVINSIVDKIDSFAYEYKKKKLVRIIQFQKAPNKKYLVKGEARFFNDDGKKLIDAKYSDEFSDRYLRCEIRANKWDKYNLLENDFCYFLAILEKYDKNFTIKSFQTKNFKLNVEVSQIKRLMPFVNGSFVKELKIKMDNSRLKRVNILLYEEANKIEYEYKRDYTYLSNGDILSIRTTELPSNKQIELLKFDYKSF